MGIIGKDEDFHVVASGDLASRMRTIGGLLGQFEIAGLEEAESIEILKRVGLPAQAYDDPSFPISLDQDFAILSAVRQRFPDDVSLVTTLFTLIPDIKINMFGLMGLAMQSAPTVLDAIQVPLTYPQMNWGRSRMILKSSPSVDKTVYELDWNRLPKDTPEEMEKIQIHGILLDLIGSIALMIGIIGNADDLLKIKVQVEKPDDWALVEDLVPCPVEFEADETAMISKPGFQNKEPMNAHRLGFKGAMQLVEREASMLAEDISVSDRVRRWLWAYTPPLKKTEIADLVGLSERSLTRQLSREGYTYNGLFAEVQAERAVNLLANDDLSVSEVGYRLGYTEPAAFSRAFTSWKDVSPSQWRAGH